MRNKLIFLVLFLILLAPAVLSAPPQQNEGSVTGLVVSFPDYDYWFKNTAFEIPVHIYRAGDGIAINTSSFCRFHIYNSTGNHIYEGFDDTPSHDYDYEVEVNNSVFTREGAYSLQVYCECDSCSDINTDLGGYERHTFIINNTGAESISAYWLLGVVFGLLAFASILGFFIFYFDKTHILLKLFFSFVIMIVIPMITNVMRLFLENTYGVSQSIINALNTVYGVSLWVLYLFVAYVVFYYGVVAVKFMIEWLKPK